MFYQESNSCFFKEATNAITTIKDINIILEEAGEFFDLDIPERKVKSGMVNYKIQSIDPMDMTGIKKQYYIMLGEIGVSYPDGTGDEEFVAVANKVFLEYVTHNDITKVDDGFIVSLPVFASHQVIKRFNECRFNSSCNDSYKRKRIRSHRK
ncbi:hypothetical protein ACT7C9_23180 [Bacillus cereus]